MKVLKDKMAMTDIKEEANTAASMIGCIRDEMNGVNGYLPFLRAKIDAAKASIDRIDRIIKKYEKKGEDDYD